MSTLTDQEQAFLADVRRIAEEVAGPNAESVDREARFPREAIDALREIHALAALVPTELGGLGLSLEAVAAACYELGRRCGASSMVYGMHQIQVDSIVRHRGDSAWYADYLRRLAAEERLIASATSEIGTGGDMGRSVAAVTPGDDGACSFEKQAPVISYGQHADDLFTTVRRAPDAEGGDQVVVLTHLDATTMEPLGSWDPLGMRGTCSPGAVVRATFPAEQVLPTPFAHVSTVSMTPVTHILWAHTWLGVATDAFERARAFVRAQAKQKPGETPASALRLSHLMSELGLMRAEVASALADYRAALDADGGESLETLASALRVNNIKISASEQLVRVCQGALGVTGIMGFKNDTPFSVGRQLRDALSAPLMVANERIHQTNAGLLLIAKDV